MSLVKGMQKGHHLEVTPAGVVVEVKNSKGCCNSKKVTLETQRDRLAITALADRLNKGTGLNEDLLELYAAVRNKEKQVDSLISGFINWILAIFKSKAYRTELKLLRTELQKFGALFDQHRMIEAIKVKYFGAGYVASPAADKKAFDELRKVVPALFNNKPDFKKAPFFIRQEGVNYSVVLPPADAKQPSKTVPIDRLDQLPGIHKRAHAKELFEAVKSESTALSVVSNPECENAVGKVELSYLEERDLNKNELSITYYNPAVGKVCKKVDLSAYNSVADLKADVEACKQESTNSKANIQARHADLQHLISGLNLTVETSLIGKEYIVRTQGATPKAISLPFGLTSAEYKKQLEQKLQNVYLDEYHRLYPAETRLISSEQLQDSKTWTEWERFGFKLDLQNQRLQIHYYNFETGEKNECKLLPTTIIFSDDFTAMRNEIMQIKSWRKQKQNTLSEICKLSQEIAMDSNEACLKAVGCVKIDYDKAQDKATISYYDADRHHIETAGVGVNTDDVANIDYLRQEIEKYRMLSQESYQPVQDRLDAISKLPNSFSVSYDFVSKKLNLIRDDGTDSVVEERFELSALDQEIVKKAKELSLRENPYFAICAQSKLVAMHDEEACDQSVGHVEIVYDQDNGRVTTRYYDAEQHQIIEHKDVPVTTPDEFKKRIEELKKTSLDSYQSIEAKINAINKVFPVQYQVSYSFIQQQFILKQQDGINFKEIKAFGKNVAEDDIKDEVEGIIIDTYVALSQQDATTEPGKLVPYTTYASDPQNLANIGAKYNRQTKKIDLFYFDQAKEQQLELEFAVTSEDQRAAIRNAINHIVQKRNKVTDALATLATLTEAVRKEFFGDNAHVKLADLLRDLAIKKVEVKTLQNRLGSDGELTDYGIDKNDPDAIKAVRQLLIVYSLKDYPALDDDKKNGAKLAQLLRANVPLIEQGLGIITAS